MQGNITDWGKEVKKGLIERGWSINDLAERIGKSRTRVSGVVNGRIYSDSIASAISDLLNIEKASASMKEATRDWCMDARKAMIDLDMNTGELADKTGYSTQYLNAIICGRCYSPPVMKVISGALGIQEYQGKQLNCNRKDGVKKWEEALRKVMKMCILLPEKGQQCTTRGYTPEKVRRSCLAYLFQHSQIMSWEIRR